MIGCYAHRFALWVKQSHQQYEELIDGVNNVMKELRNLLGAAALEHIQQQRDRPELVSKIRNTTRWSSTYEMIERFNILREDIQLITLPPILAAMEIVIDLETKFITVAELQQKFEPFESVTKALQARDLTIFDAQSLFDSVVCAQYLVFFQFVLLQ